MLQRKVSFLLKLVLLCNLALAPTVLLAQPTTANPIATELLKTELTKTELAKTELAKTEPITAKSVIANSIAVKPNPAAVLPLPSANAGTLRIDGSDEMFAINQVLKQRYEKQFPETTVELETNGTEKALQKLLNDEIDLAAVGRSLTPEEKARGLLEIPISREKIAIVVGQANPFKGDLTIDQLRQIFRGKITDWSEVGGAPGKIRVIDRPEHSDTRLALQQYQFFRSSGFEGDAKTQDAIDTEATDTIEVPSGENVVRLKQDDTTSLIRVLGNDGIGYAIASQLVDQNEVRVVKLVITLDVLPEDPLYPYVQPRGYVYKQAPGSATQAFLGFATTKPGQAAVAVAKLAEAKAVASGEKIAPTPIAKVLPPVELSDDSNPVHQNDWLRLLWGILPLLGLGLLLRWWTKRRSETFETGGPVAPSAGSAPSPALEPLSPVERASVTPTSTTPTSTTPASITIEKSPVTEVAASESEWDEISEWDEVEDELVSGTLVQATPPVEASEPSSAEVDEPVEAIPLTTEATETAETVEIPELLKSELVEAERP